MTEDWLLFKAGNVTEILLYLTLWAALVVAAALVALRFAWSASATTRHRITQAALLVVALAVFVPWAPPMGWGLATKDKPLPGAALAFEGTIADPAQVAVPTHRLATSQGQTQNSKPKEGNAAPSPLHLVVVSVWVVPGLWLLFRLFRRVLRARTMILTATVVSHSPGYLGAVRIGRHAEVRQPMCAGLLRPMIILPLKYPVPDLVSDAHAAVLLHEAAHARRGDNWDELLAQILLAIFWFNPLLHRLAFLASQEREKACDDHVRVAGVSVQHYARLLLSMLNGKAEENAVVHMSGIFEAGTLRERLLHMSDSQRSHAVQTKRSVRFGLLISAALLLGLAGALLPRAATGVVPAPTPTELTAPLAQKELAWLERLGRAAAVGDDELTTALVRQLGTSPVGSRAMRTAFMTAIRARNIELFDQLRAVDSDWSQHSGALLAAAAGGWPEGVEHLLGLGSDPDGGDLRGFQTPLSGAATAQDFDSVELLLAAGANPNREHLGSVPLISVVSQGVTAERSEMIRALVAAGADVDFLVTSADVEAVAGSSPLFDSVLRSSKPGVDLFLALGAEPNIVVPRRYPDGSSLSVRPLALAEALRQEWDYGPEVAQALREAGASEPTPAEVEAVIDARRRNRLGMYAIPSLSSDDRIAIAEQTAGLVPGLAADPRIVGENERPSFGPDGSLLLSFIPPYVEITADRIRSASIACQRGPSEVDQWQCRVVKERMRQRWNRDFWTVVSGNLTEQVVRTVGQFAVDQLGQSVGDSESLMPAYILANGPPGKRRYQVLLTTAQREIPGIELQIVEYQNHLRLVQQ